MFSNHLTGDLLWFYSSRPIFWYQNQDFWTKFFFWSNLVSRDPYFWPQNEVFLIKISLFLQLANFFVRHTYFGSQELHFKPKFDPVAQTVQELDTNIRAACERGQTSFQGIFLFLYKFTVDYFSYFIYLFWLTSCTF